ncbi:MAG: hypothetical protein WDN26_07690 [Chitinophagaceae bacterium]
MILFSYTKTPRLQYIADFIGKEISGKIFTITSDVAVFKESKEAKINYSNERIADDEFWINPHSLLFESNVLPQELTCFLWNDKKAFFKTGGDFPFDIFAACFYLLSRYEEYLPHQKDMYGRYAYENSLAYKENFLTQPLVNNWLYHFELALKEKFSTLTIQYSTFTFLPTYDIDMAWSYKHKGSWRNTGGIIKSFFTGNWKQLKERSNVLKGKQKDPFDAYGWMNQLHEKYKLKPYYFFLVAEKKGKYDKNISPGEKVMQDLIHDHVIRYPVGLHPSWQSGDDVSLLKKEIEIISKFTGSKVQSSRQHYIRFTLPESFQQLLNNGIRFDFLWVMAVSMGSGLLFVHHFIGMICKMKNKRNFYFSLSVLWKQILFMNRNILHNKHEEMKHYYNEVKSVNGTFIMIWHNSFLGTDREFAGWREVYEEFLKEVSSQTSPSLS